MAMKQPLKLHHRLQDADNREPRDSFFQITCEESNCFKFKLSNCSFTTLVILIGSFLVFLNFFRCKYRWLEEYDVVTIIC